MNREAFFNAIRPMFTVLNPSRVAGVEAILNEWEKRKDQDYRKLAYVLATVYHETGKTMQPVKEYGSEKYLKSKKYYPYYGRDLVQTTWKYNYQKVKDFTGIDVVANPDLISVIGAEVAIEFMIKGHYTGKKLSDYFGGIKEDWYNARRIINGVDRADLIARYGRQFYKALSL